ncbi:hypothetical protein TCAL_00965 [Tigriopus californicus]|uniref:ABC transporter domain-containing protein n=1 Tax=Tigriopus californicus TaxID=6832 RepID=A0A553P634_TIGCA|nr:lysosomal cobalamin transporter ABCD4-like [Tigriopus californicus]TRY73148.1 hypothetical protein TCAL_00965 [Tigriopus californicus]|eukprot:TCALIF_00965-PA protein Name:"Similar to Abcd4 ATP-binding cassette sub-family D member 4 (Mus musculus)" AED:0.00 eAED:0.00 QI:117/1/1/1/1/1/2/179/608
MADNHGYGFNVLYLRRFYRLHGLLFPNWKSLNTVLMVLLVILSGLEQWLALYVGLISGGYYKVLGDQDWSGFQTTTLDATLKIMAMVITKSFRVYVTNVMTVGWRRSLTMALHQMYFARIRYYRLNVLDESGLDNPDQRITADVSLLCQSYGSIIADLIVVPFTISYYTYSAYTRAGPAGPTGMFLFFLVSTLINKVLMSPVVRLTVEQERREGDFRFKHVTVRTHAESLAFHKSARVESVKSDEKLWKLCQTQQSLFNRQLALDLATNTFSYMGSIASFLVIAIPIFSGVYDDLSPSDLARAVSENAFVCMYLVFQFTKLVQMASTVSRLAGVTHRIGEMTEVLIHMNRTFHSQGRKSSDNSEDEEHDHLVEVLPDQNPESLVKSSHSLVLEHVNLVTPKSRTVLVQNLSLNLDLGSNLLIVGQSSAGKSSLLRVIAGLWPLDRGVIQRNLSDLDVFFLPQQPFFTDGTLREQIVYPLQVVGTHIDPQESLDLLNILEEVGLGDLPRRCGGSLDSDPKWSWYDKLSPGEMQRLAFIRLFFHGPKMAFLDESTSALSLDLEDLLYKKCVEKNIALVSVGHRETLRQYHDQVLTIGLPEGQWTLESIPH